VIDEFSAARAVTEQVTADRAMSNALRIFNVIIKCESGTDSAPQSSVAQLDPNMSPSRVPLPDDGRNNFGNSAANGRAFPEQTSVA
jgi:hypothetical protein